MHCDSRKLNFIIMEKGGKKTKVKHPNKVSSTGREIKRPKKLLTTSSDEPSQTKRPKNVINIQDRLKQLQGILASIKFKKVTAHNHNDKDAPEESVEESLNVSAKFTSKDMSWVMYFNYYIWTKYVREEHLAGVDWINVHCYCAWKSQNSIFLIEFNTNYD